jgi:hypothetical protein
MEQPGDASGTYTFDGHIVSGHDRTEPPGTSPDVSNAGTPIEVTTTRTFSDWTGEFTLEYSGNVTSNGIIQAKMTVGAPAGAVPKNTLIYIVSPNRNVEIQKPPDEGAAVRFEGVWKPERGMARVRRYMIVFRGTDIGVLESDPFIDLPQYIAKSTIWDSWIYTHYFRVGDYTVTAELQYRKPDGTYIVGSGPPLWTTSTSFRVKN